MCTIDISALLITFRVYSIKKWACRSSLNNYEDDSRLMYDFWLVA